jgi:hypothetical protein
VIQNASIEAVQTFLLLTGYAPARDFTAIECNVNGKIAGIVGFDHWTPTCVQMHVALSSPGSCRELLAESFRYAFEMTGRQVAIAIVQGASRAYRLAIHVGFREIARVKDGARAGVDLVFIELRKTECRWLKRHHRKAA